MALKYRCLIFTALWLFAGLIGAVFAESNPGESLFGAVFLAPLIGSFGIALLCQSKTAGWCLLGVFLTHAIVTLTQKTRQQFLIWTGVQIVLLTISVVGVLYFYQFDFGP